MVRALGVSLLLAAAQAVQPGRVEIDFPATIHPGRRRLLTATLGSGGPKIRAVTTNGSVTVRRE